MFKNLILFLVSMGLGSISLAGNEGHGGGGFICVKNQAISELVDLWEASAIGGLEIKRTVEPIPIQAERAINKLKLQNLNFGTLVEMEFKKLPSIMRKLSPGVALAKPHDLYNGFEKAGPCFLAGLALYVDDENVLYYDEKAIEFGANEDWAPLPITDQAALWVHEAVYKVLRDTQHVTDSRKARAIVGQLFGTKRLPKRY